MGGGMTVVFECDRRVQWNPGVFRSRSMYRAWWLWFAVSWLRIPFEEFAATEFEWRE